MSLQPAVLGSGAFTSGLSPSSGVTPDYTVTQFQARNWPCPPVGVISLALLEPWSHPSTGCPNSRSPGPTSSHPRTELCHHQISISPRIPFPGLQSHCMTWTCPLQVAVYAQGRGLATNLTLVQPRQSPYPQQSACHNRKTHAANTEGTPKYIAQVTRGQYCWAPQDISS